MPKSLALGNGNILVLLDKNAQVKDFYFPYVGLENHIGNRYFHRIGVYADGVLHWLEDQEWDVKVNCEAETLAGTTIAKNAALHLELRIEDTVYNEKNIFIRKITVMNKANYRRNIKLFFNQEFEIYESHRGDTAYYDPLENVIIHYKGRRVFLVNAMQEKSGFDDYAVGLFGIEGKEGTHKDAEDGVLSKNAIEHGLVDSTIGIGMIVEPQEESTVYYWIATAKSIKEVYEMNAYTKIRTPRRLMKTTEDFWTAWVNKQNFSFHGLDHDVISLFKKSLLIVRTHVDNNGSILAAGDSDLMRYGRDYYSYMWPRDGAYAAITLAKAGDFSVAKRFFEFCHEVITEEGYLMHKYRPDKSLGSSWHPWMRDGKPTLPIQEDETALVIYALWKYYELSKDLEFVELVYNTLIKRAVNFMMKYIDEHTGLPKPSYDLWEEKYGTSTYTSCTVYAALKSAAKFANILGKAESEEEYARLAEKIRQAILKNMYDEEQKFFHKMILYSEQYTVIDKTIDMSSIYGVFKYGILDIDDIRVKEAIKVIEDKLQVKSETGGIPRYMWDKYYTADESLPGNPWFITTLWLAQYYIASARTEKDLVDAQKWIIWTTKYALPSGILSEQIDPHTGEQISSAPLTWSHSEFIATVIQYMEKQEELGIHDLCDPIG
ncbi:MAG: hypothetical protein RI947_58 [Candidatus Parcubacteria bacterium]|jgi:oligosaccharide amylase